MFGAFYGKCIRSGDRRSICIIVNVSLLTLFDCDNVQCLELSTCCCNISLVESPAPAFENVER